MVLGIRLDSWNRGDDSANNVASLLRMKQPLELLLEIESSCNDLWNWVDLWRVSWNWNVIQEWACIILVWRKFTVSSDFYAGLLLKFKQDSLQTFKHLQRGQNQTKTRPCHRRKSTFAKDAFWNATIKWRVFPSCRVKQLRDAAAHFRTNRRRLQRKGVASSNTLRPTPHLSGVKRSSHNYVARNLRWGSGYQCL